jgi:hypothetical protein
MEQRSEMQHVFLVATARTGGTWFGKVLDTSPMVQFLWEPDSSRRGLQERIRSWPWDDPAKLRRRILGYVPHQHILPNFHTDEDPRVAVYKLYSVCGDAAFILEEWVNDFLRLRHKLGAKVIHLVRHPARWAASVKRWGDRPLGKSLEVYGRGNERLNMLCRGQPWYCVEQHETSSLFPRSVFPAVMAWLGLPLGSAFWHFVNEMHTEDRDPKPDRHSVVMEPRTVMDRWMGLTESELDMANESCRTFWDWFYKPLRRGDKHA